MRIPVDRIDFGARGYTTNDGEGIYIDFPRTLTDGFVEDFLGAMAPTPPDMTEAEATRFQQDQNRKSNFRIFELVEEWNVDGRDGKPLPLMRDLKTDQARLDLLRQMPLEFIVELARRATNVEVPEAVRDFSSGS